MVNSDRLDSLKVTVVAEDSVLYESPYLGQHGISLLLEARGGDCTRRILVDVGQNPDALLSNMQAMGIRPATIDAVVLTHCHYDHTQGLARALARIDRGDVAVIAHPTIFRLHLVAQQHAGQVGSLRHVGVQPADSQSELEKAGARLLLTEDPFVIMPGIMTTGEVRRRTSYEAMRTPLKTVENGSVVEDTMLDDISVVAQVADKGLVIVTGCSHAGIVNIVYQAREITGCDTIHGIIGGLHLVDAPAVVMRQTVADLSELKAGWIRAGHCTGFKAQVALSQAFHKQFAPLQTGMRCEV